MNNSGGVEVVVGRRTALHRRGFLGSCGSDGAPGGGDGGGGGGGDRTRLMPVHRPTFARPTTLPWPRRKSPRYVVWGAVAAALVLAAVLCGVLLGRGRIDSGGAEPPDPETPPPASGSRLHTYRRAAVCTDGPPCSDIGRGILNRNGSAVDAAVAAMFCNGLVNMASMGVGGGFFMTVYLRKEERAYSVVAREAAPGAASEAMYEKDRKAAFRGGMAVAVPGEVRGMWEAHQRWGVLKWRDVVMPSVQLCRGGFNVSDVLHDILRTNPQILTDAQLRKVFYDESKNRFYQMGKHVQPHETLCRTLQRLAESDGEEFYTGELSQDVLADLRDHGGIITADDLRRYQVNITDPIAVPLPYGDTLYTPPPPSSGVLLGFILNILSGYGFTGASVADAASAVLTFHRVVEAFKYAYATRTMLGDVNFLNLTGLIERVKSREYAASVRGNISDTRTFGEPAHYGAKFASVDDAGTAHISIIAPNGDAVSVTSSINYYFGAGFAGSRTGIVFNNVMDDFSSPTFENAFGIPPSPANFIRPYKRPLSSMSPAILLDNNRNAKMVIGASGGSKITTAIALVIMRNIWFGQTIKEAVDAPRLHHQLIPATIAYEYGITKDVLDGLKALGHNTTRYRDRGSIVCALFRNATAIYGNADYRKGGEVFGID